MNGFEAVKLWKHYERGNKEALERLVQYNKEDVINLKPLMEFAYKELSEFIKSDWMKTKKENKNQLVA